MTRSELHTILLTIIDGPLPPDDEPIDLSSLRQLELMFALEDALEFRHSVPEDVAWKCVNDVVAWLEANGELQGT